MPPTRSLRILQLCAVDFTVRQFIAPLCLALQRDGHEVRAACTPGPHWEELGQMGVTMVPMPLARSANPIRALGTVWRLYRWLRREKIDVLHVHTPVASMIGRLAGWLAGVPIIVYTAHGFYFHDRMPRHKRLIHMGLERAFGLLTSALFCVSREDAELARRVHMVPCGPVYHTGNGVRLNRFDPALFESRRAELRSTFGIPTDAAVVTIMGRLVREKGYREFFEAARGLAAAHPHAHFMVIGDTVTSEHDDAKAMIVAMAQAPELKDRVHFMGLRSDIPELLAASDIFTLPSYREGMPVSILEAMAMALPVVATNIRGCREEVVNAETGFLVEAQNAEELRQALDLLLRRPDVARRMGEAGLARVRRHFDEVRILGRQVKLYRRFARRIER